MSIFWFFQDDDYDFEDDLDEEQGEEACETALDLLRRLETTSEWHDTNQQAPSTTELLLEKNDIEIIDFSQIKVQKKIGHGGFGDVYFAQWKNEVVACKILHFEKLSKRRLEDFQSEAKILGKLKHPNIVKLIGACVGPPKFCIVTEYMEVSLYEVIHIDDEYLMTEAMKRSILLQTATGVEYLHQREVAHCDIKPQNILLNFMKDQQLTAKLADFGLSTIKKHTETTLSSTKPVFVACSPAYAAPEVLRGDILKGVKERIMTDVYSLGVVAWEVLFEDEPFADLDIHQLRKHVGEGSLVLEFPEDVKAIATVQKILDQCWDRKPTQRPTAQQVRMVIQNNEKIYDKI